MRHSNIMWPGNKDNKKKINTKYLCKHWKSICSYFIQSVCLWWMENLQYLCSEQLLAASMQAENTLLPIVLLKSSKNCEEF